MHRLSSLSPDCGHGRALHLQRASSAFWPPRLALADQGFAGAERRRTKRDHTLGPALVYASDAQVYGPALASSGLHAVAVFSQGAEAYPGALHFDSLARTAEGPAVREAWARITPDTHAKYLLTSGSTGHPKVVINSDAGADFKHVVAVLDEVRKIGISKVGINTDKK